MRLLRTFIGGLQSLLRGKKTEQELDEELSGFLEMAVEEKMKSAMSREDARRAVRLEQGSLAGTKEVIRSAGWESFVQTCWQDLRSATRIFRKNPGLTLVAVLTAALGIAANVTVFSVIDGLFLRSVPAKNPERLVRIIAPENDGEGLFSIPEFAYLRDNAKTVEELTAHYSTAPLYTSANGETGEVTGAVVSGSYFSLLGLQPYLGRFFTNEEDSVPDRDAVAVLGYGFWQRIYNGDSGVIGKTLLINGHSFPIVGIVPPEFRGTEIGGTPVEIWIPAMMIRVGYRSVTEAMPLMDQVRGAYKDTRIANAVVSCAALLALILSTMGLYGVVSYEVTRRTKEIGVRTALGARPHDVLHLFLREGFRIVLTGVLFGAVLALATTRLLGAWLFGVSSADMISFGIATAVLLVATVTAAYLPVRRAMRVDPIVALRYE